MHIKSSTVIPAGMKITRVPASTKKVQSLYSLERAHERRLETQAELKAKSDRFTEYLKAGYTVQEALQLING